MGFLKKIVRKFLELDTSENIKKNMKKFDEDVKATQTMINHDSVWFNACSEGSDEEKECFPK